MMTPENSVAIKTPRAESNLFVQIKTKNKSKLGMIQTLMSWLISLITTTRVKNSRMVILSINKKKKPQTEIIGTIRPKIKPSQRLSNFVFMVLVFFLVCRIVSETIIYAKIQ